MNMAITLLGQADKILPIVWTIGLALLVLLAFSIEEILRHIERRIASLQEREETE